jgi:mycofactocin precursor
MSPTTRHDDRQATAVENRQPDHASTVVDPPADGTSPVEEDLVEEDLLVEDVSIDGMCGVY